MKYITNKKLDLEGAITDTKKSNVGKFTKKTIALCMSAIVLFSLIGCSSEKKGQEKDQFCEDVREYAIFNEEYCQDADNDRVLDDTIKSIILECQENEYSYVTYQDIERIEIVLYLSNLINGMSNDIDMASNNKKISEKEMEEIVKEIESPGKLQEYYNSIREYYDLLELNNGEVISEYTGSIEDKKVVIRNISKNVNSYLCFKGYSTIIAAGLQCSKAMVSSVVGVDEYSEISVGVTKNGDGDREVYYSYYDKYLRPTGISEEINNGICDLQSISYKGGLVDGKYNKGRNESIYSLIEIMYNAENYSYGSVENKIKAKKLG